MERVLLDAVVRTDYGQLDLVWSNDGGFDGDVPRFFTGQTNGLVGAADPGGVYIHLARRSGGSRVRAVLHDSEPPLPAPYYEDIVEVSITIPPDTAVRWQTWAGESGGALEGLPPGTYRMRVSAHGRDAGSAGEFEDGIVDEYLLELWRAGKDRDVIVRTGSQNAQYFHRTWGAPN